MMGEIEEKIERKIKICLQEFKRYPEKFLTEEDVRSYLYSLLVQEFGQIETCSDLTESTPLHCEVRWYGRGRLKLRSDIVIIDVSTLRTKGSSYFKLPTKGYCFYRPKAIIEIKLRRRGRQSDAKFSESICKDRQKLINVRSEIDAKFSSYMIIFDKKKNLFFQAQNTSNHKEYYIFPY